MAQERPEEGTQAPPKGVSRVFEQPPEAISLYSDYTQVVGTGHEVMLQFYETIPGAPGPKGGPETVRSRLRATVTLSPAHAANLGRMLLEHSERGASAARGEAYRKGEQ